MHVPRIRWVVALLAVAAVVVVFSRGFQGGGSFGGALDTYESVPGTGTLVISGRESEAADLQVTCLWFKYRPEGSVEFESALLLIDDFGLTVSVPVGDGPPRAVRIIYPTAKALTGDQYASVESHAADEYAVDAQDDARTGTASFAAEQSAIWGTERVVPAIAGTVTWTCQRGLNAPTP